MNKTAFIAGGTAGIGLAVAADLTEHGARVVIAGRRPQGADIAADAGCEFVTLNVADADSWQAALTAAEASVGRFDAVILNAAIAQPPTSIAGLDADVAREVVDTDLLGTFWGLKHSPAHMNDGGSIVITSSISAVMGTPFEALYGATKAGVTSLARSGAIDLGPRGIRVNAIQPGPTWTDMNPMPESLFEVMAPLQRKGKVEDLVGAYRFLVSDESRYLTGQAITIDGGITAGLTQAQLGLLAGAAA